MCTQTGGGADRGVYVIVGAVSKSRKDVVY